MIEHEDGLVSANNRTYTSNQYADSLKQEEARQEAHRRERVKWHMLNEEFNRNPDAFIKKLEAQQSMNGHSNFMRVCGGFMRNNSDVIHGFMLVAVMFVIGACGAM